MKYNDNKSALDTQVGGDHYKVYVVEPCLLMRVLSGPAAHIAGYILRTKGEDDLEKAEHWCDLMSEADANGYPDPVSSPVAYQYACQWLHMNHKVVNTEAYRLKQILYHLIKGDWLGAKTHISILDDERRGIDDDY